MSFFSVLISLSACSSTREMPPAYITEPQADANYTKPVKIFGIGGYKRNSVILTLVDAKERYYTVEAPLDTTLKVGNVYAK